MNIKADVLKAHVKSFMLESQLTNALVSDMMREVEEHFLEHLPEVQETLIYCIDEMAQETVRKRDIFDTTLANLKKLQEEAHGG